MNPDRSTFVSADRLTAWVDRFAAAHQGLAGTADTDDGVLLRMHDGAVALLSAPWPDDGRPGRGADLVARLASRAAQERRLAVVLVRRGGYAVGVSVGGKLLAHKVGTVSSRSRGGDQAAAVVTRATQEAAKIFTGQSLEYVATGGDKALVDSVLNAPALRKLRDSRRLTPLAVAEPNMAALQKAATEFCAVRIAVTDAA